MTEPWEWDIARDQLREIGFTLTPKASRAKVAEQVERFQEGFAFGALDVDGDPGPLTRGALQHSVENEGRCSPNFKFREFASKGQSKEILVEAHLVLALEQARELMGGKPINITSAYRDPDHNKSVGGKSRSQHLFGRAVDVPFPAVETVKGWGLFTGIGVELATGTVSHVDVRRGDPAEPTMWGYKVGGGHSAALPEWENIPVSGPGLKAFPKWETKAATEAPLAEQARETARNVSDGAIEPAAARAVEYIRSLDRHRRNTPEHVQRILDVCRGAELLQAQTAYVLATALHESHMGGDMVEHASGDAYEGRADLGNIHKGDGRRFKGRGYVQLTGRTNYRKWTRHLNDHGHELDLEASPKLVEEPGIAAVILVHGMKMGSFTGRGLGDYITAAEVDFFNARRIVNATDKAAHIAGFAEGFLAALDAA